MENQKTVNKLIRSLNAQLKAKSLETGINIDDLKRNLETAKIEQLEDGSFEITRFHSIAKYSSSQADFNLRLWYNTCTRASEIRAMITSFVQSCDDAGAV